MGSVKLYVGASLVCCWVDRPTTINKAETRSDTVLYLLNPTMHSLERVGLAGYLPNEELYGTGPVTVG